MLEVTVLLLSLVLMGLGHKTHTPEVWKAREEAGKKLIK